MTRELSSNERLILYGLVKYPNANNKELAESLGLNPSTLTTIKRRLKKGGFFRTITVPRMDWLSCELVQLTYANFNPAVPIEERVKKSRDSIEKAEEVIYSAGEPSRGFSITISRDYTNLANINDTRMEVFARMNVLESEHPEVVIFPYRTSRILRFLDYATLMQGELEPESPYRDGARKDVHGLEGAQAQKKRGKRAAAAAAAATREEAQASKEEAAFAGRCGPDLELSDTEKQVLVGLVEHPDLNDRSIGEKIHLSRATVSNQRRNFIKSGLITRKCIPNLRALDFEILGLTHLRLNPRAEVKGEELEKRMLECPNIIFLCGRRFEMGLLAVYKNYDQFKEEKLRQLRLLKETNLFLEPPINRLFSVSQTVTIKDVDYGPLLKKVLGVNQ